jgi:hypothetical protein
MSTQYIVKFSKDMNNFNSCMSSSDKVDGFVELMPSKGNYSAPSISVRTEEDSKNDNNVQLLFKFITSNFANIDFDDTLNTCSLKYRDGYSQSLEYNSLIQFDGSSSSAYSQFKKSFEELMNTKKETTYHNSGRVKYVGDMIMNDDSQSKDYNGSGILYYDNHKRTIKYQGEFENNEFDGAGTFHNIDNNITLIANNISDGIPVQKGKLHINFKNRQQVFEITFSELWEKLSFKSINKMDCTKRDQKRLVKSDDFLNIVASIYLETADKNVNQFLFEERSVSEQNLELLEQIQCLKLELLKSRKDMNINMNNLVSVGKAFASFLVFNILLNVVVIYVR